MTEALKIVQDGRLLRIAFAREGGGVSDSMASALSAVLARAPETSDAVLLTAAGPDFCTGRVRDVAGPPSPEAYTRRDEYSGIFGSYTSIRECPIPVVAAIEGRAMGYGLAVAAICDVSFASDTATFNIPEIENNVMPTMVMSAVADRMSRNALLWMAYSADFIDAQQALGYGIVSRVVPAACLAAEAERFCQVLLGRPKPAVLGLKEYLRVAPKMDERGATDYARSLHSMVNTAGGMRRVGH